MPQMEDQWPKVRQILIKFHIPEHQINAIKLMRASLIEEASRGMPHLPEFTLHNADHSDNLIHLLEQFRKNLQLKLSPYEAFLLSAGIYLHDIGMYFTPARFEQDIQPDWQNKLPFCPKKYCDRPELYRVESKTTGDKIRELHNVLSAYLLLQTGTSYGLDIDDIPYVVQIARGHRRVDLATRECNCYMTDRLDDQVIRLSLLTSLLRLIDAMDFGRNRAPQRVFQNAALDFLKNPIALEHWVKHYFAKSSEIQRVTKDSEPCLLCTAYFSVPNKLLNESSYQVFFEPLILLHVQNINRTDLNQQYYPIADLHEALGVKRLHLEYSLREQVGSKTIPADIISSIKESQARNVSEFIKWLGQPRIHEKDSKDIPEGISTIIPPVVEKRNEHKFRVLFLEDELQLAETLPAVIESKQNTLEVVGLANIDAAVELLEKEDFDVVLTDIIMPSTKDMDLKQIEYGRLTGIAFAMRVKNIRPNIPIIALTVIGDSASRRKMLAAGISEVISKPASIKTIIDTLLNVLEYKKEPV